jgi:hypothetical protein
MPRRGVRAVLAGLSVAMVAFLSYRDTLAYFFNATDDFTLIETSRFRSITEAAALFGKPLMGGSDFTKIGLFYRPVATLSYGADYLTSGIDPFGYHVTNVVLFAMLAVAVVGLVASMTGRLATAWLSGLVFALHPIHVESVPAVARRQDVLAALCTVLCLACVSLGGTGPLVVGVVACGLALGSKEIGILLPVMIYVYYVVAARGGERNEGTWLSRMVEAGRRCAPFFAICGVYLVARTWVLGGMGGYKELPFGRPALLAFLGSTTKNYVRDLVYPASLASRALPFSVASLVAVGALSTWLARRELAGSATTSAIGRTVGVLLIWLVLPLCLFVATRTFADWSMVLSVVPFSAIVALALTEPIRVGRSLMSGGRRLPATRWLALAAVCWFASAATLVGYLVGFSPLVRDYGEWEDSGKIASMVVRGISRVVHGIPPGTTTIRIAGLPYAIGSYATETPRVRTASYLQDHSIESWVKLTEPDAAVDVVIDSRVVLGRPPAGLGFATHVNGEGETVVDITVEE